MKEQHDTAQSASSAVLKAIRKANMQLVRTGDDASAFSMQATLVRMWVRQAMRDAIARWGQPSGVGEPVYQASYKGGFWQDCSRERYEYLLKAPTISSSVDWTLRILYTTTTQTTHAQAGAVPLTVDEVEQLIAQWSYELHGDRARYLVRMTEQHHGIKGDQHER